MTLTVGGTNFVPGAIVYFNNTVLITTYLGATGLIASVPASVLIQSGPYPITVVNPPPGGGSSQSIQFFVQSTHIQLSMTSPISGSFINGSTALVLGTVSSDNGEVGVVVNGVIAQVNGNQFVANHVPLVPGANLITATATDVEGNTRSASIAVTSDGAENPVTLLANPESGVAPLAVSFSILTTLGIPVTSYTLDADGDGTANFTSVALSDSFNYTYAQPGFYVATATLTDDQGNVYTDSVAVNVLSLTELDMLLQSRWKGMKVALISKDINTAIGYLAEGAKSKYQGLFERFGDHLPIIAGNLPALQLVRIDGDVAAYHVTQMENGVEKAHFVYFVRDANGLWRLQAF
ncbi:MAG: PKD domain-containing protein [Nitrospirae bacterium]|nr:PKD domain-containing protein [Nitrospirota bacterium]